MGPLPDTKERILDAAEALFAAKGYDATSLRAVIQEAGVNLAAVHYHYGSKLLLFRAVVARRVDAINAERLARLDALASAPGAPGHVEALVEAFFAPALLRAVDGDSSFLPFVRIVGHSWSGPGEHVQALREVFRPVQARFVPAFAAALPQLGAADLFWRMHFLIGAMCTFLSDRDRVRVISDGLCDPADVLREFVVFASAALRAPAAPGPAPKRRVREAQR